jgi:hypothetical protein
MMMEYILGKDNVCKRGEEEKIYHILERKLWDDPNKVSSIKCHICRRLAFIEVLSEKHLL